MSGSGRRVAAPRGTRDVLPPESDLRQRVIDVAREAFARYGYSRVVTPTFEETDLFVRGVGTSTDVVRKEMYTFEDQGGRSLSLRPEGTAPVVRAFVEHGMHKQPLPVKLWYAAPMFRYEAPQAGRFREHWQVGAEAIGSDDPLLDAEVIALLAGIYRELGVPGVTLRIGSMGDPESRGPFRERLVAYLEDHLDALDEDARERMRVNPLRLFDTKDPRVAEVMRDAPTLLDNLSPAAQAHRERVLEALDALGIAYVEDPTLVRGFDYYTMTVFEFVSDHLGAQSAVGGGRALRRPGRGARRAAHPGHRVRRRHRADRARAGGRRGARRARPLPRGDGRRPARRHAPGARGAARPGAAVRERPARAQPEGHDAPRVVARRPPRGDRRGARARRGRGDGQGHGHG